MPRTFDLLVNGDAGTDVTIGPLDTPLAFGRREQLVPVGALAVGGPGATVARGAARHGLRVAFTSRVSNDNGRRMRGRLGSLCIDAEVLRTAPHRPTPTTVTLTREDGRATPFFPAPWPHHGRRTCRRRSLRRTPGSALSPVSCLLSPDVPGLRPHSRNSCPRHSGTAPHFLGHRRRPGRAVAGAVPRPLYRLTPTACRRTPPRPPGGARSPGSRTAPTGRGPQRRTPLPRSGHPGRDGRPGERQQPLRRWIRRRPAQRDAPAGRAALRRGLRRPVHLCPGRTTAKPTRDEVLTRPPEAEETPV
ncbi:PfkB family carbohydrate kinase [Streptomyces chartreusis]|uniref:PfkB family carbohydrate kinase n=1 Tax=Streptomyces chartreusis TaxID=1969 RepID=UPI0036902A8C